MGEGSFGVAVSLPASVVMVVRSEDEERVQSVNESDLIFSQTSSVDGQGIHSDTPQRDSVQGSFTEDHHIASL